jgi:hypothetical protein
MKTFVIETPVLRLRYDKFYYQYRGYSIMCRDVLAKLFQIEQPKRISFLLSSKYSRNAKKFTVEVIPWESYEFAKSQGCDAYFFDCDKFNEPTELANSIADRWLSKHTPLGQLKPGESATVYVTLFVHEE